MNNYKDQLYLQHFGVQGMRWGVRRGASAVKRYGKALGVGIKNTYVHPVAMGKAIKEAQKSSSFMTNVRKATLGYSTKEIESVNARVNSLLAEKKAQKRDKFVAKVNKDIDSFTPYLKTGIKSKSGKTVLTAEDVAKCQQALIATRDKALKK